MTLNHNTLARIPLSWTRYGDNWISRFEFALNEADLILAGHKFDDTTKPYVELYVALAKEPNRIFTLLVAPSGGDSFDILVASEDVPSTVVEAWLDSAAMAARLIGDTRGPLHNWTAIIGPPSARVGEVRAGVDCEGLAAAGNIGPLFLSSTGRYLVESRPLPEQPSFEGGSRSSSIPILVKGSHAGYSWDDAAVLAACDLNRACGLLSVAWGVCITVRESPAPLEWGVRIVPDRVAGVPEGPPPLTASVVVDREIPTWANDAWAALSGAPRLADAVAACHEGMKVEYAHPSLALVAFVSSIEAVSQMLFREDRCSECKSHQNIAAKFRETLKLVLSENEAAELSEAYSPRSHTVHRGRLHGYESVAGSFGHGIWPLDERHAFRWGRVYRMRDAARAILVRALKKGLPPKRQFKGD